MAIVRVAVYCMAFVGCTGERRVEEVEALPPTGSVCGPQAWGIEAYDALERVDGVHLLVDPADAVLDAPGAASALRRAAEVDPRPLPIAARIALQNDVWGLVQRVASVARSGATTDAVLSAARSLMERLAPTAAELATLGDPMAPPARDVVLPSSAGWVERDTPMPVLQHELLFGRRRVFRVLESPSGGAPLEGGAVARALLSVLVALDASGAPRLTPIVGEIELLDFGVAPARRARVLHLSRRALRCRGLGRELEEHRAVQHIPSEGANGFLLDVEEAVDLASFPCVRCHDDDAPMSLPTPGDPRSRIARVLAEVSRP